MSEITYLYKKVRKHPYCKRLEYKGGNRYTVWFGFTVGCFSSIGTHKNHLQSKVRSLNFILKRLDFIQRYEKSQGLK